MNYYNNHILHSSGHIKTSSLHQVYYERYKTNDNSIPLIFIHGGPGAGTSIQDLKFFNPSKYDVVLIDQRGCGKSTPLNCVSENTTHHLIEDIQLISKQVGFTKFVLFGGSWGSTLCLAYAQKYPNDVLGLILRGIFTLREEEINWFYQQGASFIYPDLFEEYIKPIPLNERDNLVKAYYKRLFNEDNKAEMITCAKAWAKWELSTATLVKNKEIIKKVEEDELWALAFAKIECHYFYNKGFFEFDGQLIENANIIEQNSIPTYIVQGRYDLVCPCKSAWDLKNKIKSAQLFFVDKAGHSAKEEPIADKLMEICDELAIKLSTN